jgi:NAD(P)-dependent dehydrogenase (short-subunit alcohol dehydrogenase family)
MSLDLTGKRVLVVGAAGGIGRATAISFADAGAQLTVAGRTKTSVVALAEALGAVPASLDVLDEEAIQTFFAQQASFDHVVIAAASTKMGSVAALPLADAKAAMESKFWGAYRIAHAARISSGGSLTFVSGLLAERPMATSVLQGAINAALEALARGLALERAPVRVNTVSPGLIDTPLHNRMEATAREAMYERMRQNLPVRRMGEPEDIAAAILLVATNPFMTGATVNVDGGGRFS